MAFGGGGNQYKIRLASGRVLGPIGLGRIRELILAGQLLGGEQAREHPQGEWLPLGAHPGIADLLLRNAQGKLASDPLPREAEPAPVDPAAATRILEGTRVPEPEPASLRLVSEPAPEAEEATRVVTPPAPAAEAEDQDRTAMVVLDAPAAQELPPESDAVEAPDFPAGRTIAHEKTVVFRTPGFTTAGSAPSSRGARRKLRPILLVLGGMLVLADLLGGSDDATRAAALRTRRIRPSLPAPAVSEPNPAKSKELYDKALKSYQYDTLPGYRKAVQGLQAALKQDPGNVRALAFLASSYLNLIDVSNKDENYFSVILKLIQLSRAKDIELPETLISDAEYLTLTGRPLAAQTRIIEYSKRQKNYSEIIILYLAQALFARGEFVQAARYLAAIPQSAGMVPKTLYLRGRVAEALGEGETALREYRAVLQASPNHGYARLRIVKMADAAGSLGTVRKELAFITSGADHLPPRELAEAFFIRSRLEQAEGRVDLALGYIERALGLEPENADYNLNYFLLRAKAGDSLPELRKDARVYFYMAESERLIREGKFEDAQIQLMEARREAPENPQPLVRLANLFSTHKGDIANARISLKKAADLAPTNVRIWSRYIELLIQSYEWEEANRALARLRTLPVPQGAIDKAMADWYARQGRHIEAQQFYKKALARESIEPSVYIALGKSLLETKQYEQAPFVFALAQRFDPENAEAITGTARAIEGSEGIDRSIEYLRDELQKGSATRVDLLCALAEMLVTKGAWDEAQAIIDQARQSRPEMALPYRALAKLVLARPTSQRTGGDLAAKQKAAEAYQSYLDRNPADATILFEKYRVLVDLSEFKAADDTLDKIYELYPKFPNLHFSKGLIYVRLSNFKAAQTEFEQEIKNGNASTQVLLALGAVHLEQGQAEKALGHFVQAMQRSPREAEPKSQAAYANFLLKKYEASAALYREALKLDSGNPIIYRRMGDSYRAMGDVANARQAYQKYLEMEPDAPDRDSLFR
jgi:tetratricopeptide (TPR) repeat protein